MNRLNRLDLFAAVILAAGGIGLVASPAGAQNQPDQQQPQQQQQPAQPSAGAAAQPSGGAVAQPGQP